MKPKDKIKEIARGLFGDSADICTSWSETPKVYIGIVENGVVKEILTPSFMPI